MSITRVAGIVCLSLFLSPHAGYSQEYPNKPIRIVTTTVGGGNDFTARLIAQGMTELLGQHVIVDNRIGIVAGEVLAKAQPDGYALGINDGSLWISPLLVKAPFDPERDFAPISVITREANVVTVQPSLPVNSIKELISLAKAKPGELNYGSGPTGTSNHLAAELFKTMAGVNIVRIPYGGGGAALVGVMSGQVQMAFTSANSVSAQVKAGKLKALAVTSAQPSVLSPGLPTVAATGLPGYESVTRSGMFAPAKTSTAMINRLNRELVRVASRSDLKEKFLSAGIELITSTPQEFAATIKSERATVLDLIKHGGIRIE